MPARTSARSFSIFMRPPRPWPSWRRARSRLRSSGSSSSPAGRPSSTAVRPGPCDSPAVVKRSAMAPLSLPALGRSLALRGERGELEELAERVHGLLAVRLAAGGHGRRARRLGLALRSRGALVLRVALRLFRREEHPRDPGQLQRVLAAAVGGGQRLLVARVVQVELHERAGLRRRLALALARRLVLRGVDQEDGGLEVRAHAHEYDHGALVVGQHPELLDVLVGLLVAARAEAHFDAEGEVLAARVHGAAATASAGAGPT